jgi:hypothetical protein
MAQWWPIDSDEYPDRGCDACGEKTGRSRDDQDRIFCPTHRHLHGS